MWLCYLMLYLVMKLVLVRGSRLTTADTGDLCLSSEQIAGQQKQKPSSFPLASLSQPSSLGYAMCLLPSFILCCICSTSQNKGKVKPVHTGELSSPGKLEHNRKTLCIKYYIISTALMLCVSSFPFPWDRRVSYISFRMLVFIVSSLLIIWIEIVAQNVTGVTDLSKTRKSEYISKLRISPGPNLNASLYALPFWKWTKTSKVAVVFLCSL